MPARLPDYLRRTPATRAKEWRASKRKLLGTDQGELFRGFKLSGPSGKSGKHQSLFDTGEFVAVDGEGFSEGEEFTIDLGEGKGVYKAKRHSYALLSASDGSEIYEPNGRLDGRDCFDFMLRLKESSPRAILVCFGGSYDVCQMVAHCFSKDELRVLLGGRDPSEGPIGNRHYLDKTLGDYDYRLELRPRKSFTVMRWRKGEKKYERNTKGDLVKTPCAQATLWDVWGFFQDSFVGVMRKWIPDSADYRFISQMKGERSIFERSEIESIREYNKAELRCLVQIMDRVRDAVAGLGLKLTRWDGAGAIAGAMLRHHAVKAHKAKAPEAVFQAARHAYSGGHIEVCQIGYHDGPVYHYDVNSAYPAEFAKLPSLAEGRWIYGRGSNPPEGFTLVRSRWDFFEGNSFYPLFYREGDGTILYPRNGEGWHWFPEWDTARDYALQFGANRFDVVEWWHFQPASDTLPFGWVRDYYQRRQALVAQAKASGIESGEEKIIKLGLNSLYGKTAQQIGASIVDGEIREPAYFQLEWAGAVTAGCRAKLMRAAIQNMPSVIGFATDGIFTTAPLDLDAPAEKVLGAWEAQVYDGITMVMPGVYWLHKNGSKPKHYSRGFDKQFMSDCEFVHDAWRRQIESVPVKLTRLIGLGSAVASDALWPLRGCFATTTRTLAMNGDNSKRYPAKLYRQKPHKGLVHIGPRGLAPDQYDMLGNPILSAEYGVSWLDGDMGLGASVEEEREAIDADLA